METRLNHLSERFDALEAKLAKPSTIDQLCDELRAHGVEIETVDDHLSPSAEVMLEAAKARGWRP